MLDEVARLAFANVRELKGALNKLSAYQQLEGQPVEVADVRAVLGERAGAASTPGGSLAVERRPSPMPGRIEAIIPAGTDYDGFLADVLQEVESRVEPWRVKLGEAIAQWRPQGYAVSVLERAMALPTAPDVDGLLRAYGMAVERLRQLEMQAVAVDAGLRGHAAFRDPEAIPAAQSLVQDTLATAIPLPAPSPAFTREGLEISAGNQLALRAPSMPCSTNPANGTIPCCCMVRRAVAKSHTAHAIGNAMKQGGTRVVACLSARVFVEELVAAMQEGGVERWRNRYRSADVFILDDIQHLVGKERTQDELFHLFNHLVSRGSQVVLTSDRAPRDLAGLADRLRSRFEGGLVVALPARERMRVEQLVTRAPGELDRFYEDREKTMWDWPELGGRLIEEYR